MVLDRKWPKDLYIDLGLTKGEWAEVQAALDTKINRVERGDYGEDEGDSRDEKWLKVLRSALRKIEATLDERGVTY